MKKKLLCVILSDMMIFSSALPVLAEAEDCSVYPDALTDDFRSDSTEDVSEGEDSEALPSAYDEAEDIPDEVEETESSEHSSYESVSDEESYDETADLTESENAQAYEGTAEEMTDDQVQQTVSFPEDEYEGSYTEVPLSDGAVLMQPEMDQIDISSYGTMAGWYDLYSLNGADEEVSDEALNAASAYPSAYTLNPDTAGLFTHSVTTAPYNRVTSVKVQGTSGLCWAFSGIASLESSVLTEGCGSVSASSVDLSEIQAAYYAINRSEAALPEGCEGDTSSSNAFSELGGNNEFLITSLAAGLGAAGEETASLSSFFSGNLSSDLTSGKLASAFDSYYLSNASFYSTRATSANLNAIKEAIMTTGAVATSLYSGSDYVNNTTAAWYNDGTAAVNHAVVIVGWDDNYSVSNFNASHRPSYPGAWLIKNSWGSSFGKNGYYWVSYYDYSLNGKSGVAVSYQVCDTDSYDHNYQYDGGINYAYINTNANTAYAANIFKAEGAESLDAVSLYCLQDNTSYTVSIYTDCLDGQPSSGKLAASQSGIIEHAGFHMIDLDTIVNLTSGQSFSVVFKLTDTTSGNARIPIEYAINVSSGSVSLTSAVHADEGESFYSVNGSSWHDCAGYTSASNHVSGVNVRIKAFTTDTYNARRLGGINRYLTAYEIIREAYPEAPASGCVILVKGTNFPDALSASSLAGALDCPILMTPENRLVDADRILLNDDWGGAVSKVYVIGNGLSDNVFNTLVNQCGISRSDIIVIAGNNRYQTAEAVCEYGLSNGLFDTDEVIMANGNKAADALSVSPWSNYYKIPILLTNGNAQLTDKSRNLVSEFSRVIMLGSENVVSDQAVNAMTEKEKIRLGGVNRYATSEIISEYFASRHSEETGYVTTAVAFVAGADQNFPDSLVGGTLMAKEEGSLILVSPNASANEAARIFIQTKMLSSARSRNMDSVYFLGGVAALSQEQAKQIYSWYGKAA